MLFATLYLLVMSLDILVALDFRAYGMIPFYYFTSGIALFLLVFLWPRFIRRANQMDCGWIYRGFWLVVLMVFLERFAINMAALFGVFGRMVSLIDSWRIFASAGSAFLALWVLHRLSLRDRVHFWMFFSLAGVSLRGALNPLTMNQAVWRFSGIFDLPFLFGWLTLIHTLMKKEYHIDG